MFLVPCSGHAPLCLGNRSGGDRRPALLIPSASGASAPPPHNPPHGASGGRGGASGVTLAPPRPPLWRMVGFSGEDGAPVFSGIPPISAVSMRTVRSTLRA